MIIFIAFISLILLVIIHELGHFLTAKYFKIRVDEFGIGYPPRIFGKKFKGTLYSLNLLPFGAFVKIYGHEERIDSPDSFSTKPIWQRALVILGGVVSFWIVAAIILSIMMIIGIPSIVSDSDSFKNAKVQIISISKDSPASQTELEIGDAIVSITASGQEYQVNKVGEVQDIISRNKGEQITIKFKRGSSENYVSATPRIDYSKEEGSLGVGLIRTGLKTYPWYLAPLKGVVATWDLTVTIVEGWYQLLASLFSGRGVPRGVEMRGIVGIFDLFVQVGGMGASYFLQFIAIISVSLAVLNILPIPALDGGWLVLLGIEKIMGKPINHKVEKTISAFFFLLLLILMVFITIKDIMRFF